MRIVTRDSLLLDVQPVSSIASHSDHPSLIGTAEPAGCSQWTWTKESSPEYLLSPSLTAHDLVLTVAAVHDEKLHATIRLPSKIRNKYRRQGYEPLIIDPNHPHRGKFIAYRLFSTRQPDIVMICATPPPSDFMAHIPSHTPLGQISMIGTHESCARYGYPISQCQQPSTPIAQQLLDGVRFLDVRLRVVGDRLLTYHGPRPQRSSLDEILNAAHGFLDAHPSETVMLCIKQETPPNHPKFATMVYRAFEPALRQGRWWVRQGVPSLGEVRGKGILWSRFSRNEGSQEEEGIWPDGMGVHPTRWPDSRVEGFEWDCAGTTVRTQDWYRVPSFVQIPEKFDAIVRHLLPTMEEEGEKAQPTFTLDYASASTFPLALPTTLAKGFGWPRWGMGIEGINSRLTRWLLTQLSEGRRVRACLLLDFYRDGWDLAGLVLAMNPNFADVDHL